MESPKTSMESLSPSLSPSVLPCLVERDRSPSTSAHAADTDAQPPSVCALVALFETSTYCKLLDLSVSQKDFNPSVPQSREEGSPKETKAANLCPHFSASETGKRQQRLPGAVNVPPFCSP